ncbi:MAG: hypothetical protein M0017_04745, partial [Desulfobacteraceae bacterium]|nr:hypothetical protein [Desulfobacteraceae bacterium]
SFSKILSGDIEPEAKYPAAWSWVLALLILSSFASDEGAASSSDQDFQKTISSLKQLGVLPANNLRDLVVYSSKKQFKIKIPPIMEALFESPVPQTQDLQFFHMIDNLKSLIGNFKSNNKHLVVVDGLDDILTNRNIQLRSLASLMLEVSRLNQFFIKKNAPVKIIVLCRTELFEKLPGPNKNKMRQDSAIEIDWYHDPRNPSNSKLVTLANLRAKLSLGREVNIFEDFFGESIDGKKTLTFLIEMTRHTPRDFLQILTHLQKYYKSGKFARDEVLSGCRDYSMNYFLPEIKDELVGYVSQDHIEYIIQIFSSLRKRDFYMHEIEEIARSKPRYREMDIEDICIELFNCSALGNVSKRPGGSEEFSFKYRNHNSSFNDRERIILHKGLWKALNLI